MTEVRTTPNFPDSLRLQLVNLDVGASVSLCRKLDQNTATREDLADWERRLHDTGRNAIHRAAKDTGYTYTGEIGNFRTGARTGANPVVVFLITRTK